MKPHFEDRLWPVIRGRTDDFVRRARRGRAADAIRVLRRILRNFVMRLAGRADYRRWVSPAGHETWWDERTQLIASMIPTGARVIEFGCGRRQLENFLPDECTYVPSDLVERGPGTIVCDLNTRPLPDLGHLALQVAVFGGVLEYVCDVESVIQWVRRDRGPDLRSVVRRSAGATGTVRAFVGTTETPEERLHEQPDRRRPAAMFRRCAHAVC